MDASSIRSSHSVFADDELTESDSASFIDWSSSSRSIYSYNSEANDYLVCSLSSTSSPSSLISSCYTEQLKESHGRIVNTTNEIYPMPADVQEHGRLDIQHRLLQLSIDSLYFGRELVQRALAPKPGITPAVVDIGCGSGSWVIAMAREFPHAEVVGIDLAPPTLPKSLPINCRFEIDDVNLPLPHYEVSFDVAHLRAIETGVEDFDNLLFEVARILRPGGALLLVGGDVQLYGPDLKPLPACGEGEPGFSWLQRYFNTVMQAGSAPGVRANARAKWIGYLANNPNFTNVETIDIPIPIGPWPTNLSNRTRQVSEYMQANIIELFHSFKPLLLRSDYPEDMVDRWLAAVKQELNNLDVKAYSTWRWTVAERTKEPWQARSLLMTEHHHPL